MWAPTPIYTEIRVCAFCQGGWIELLMGAGRRRIPVYRHDRILAMKKVVTLGWLDERIGNMQMIISRICAPIIRSLDGRELSKCVLNRS